MIEEMNKDLPILQELKKSLENLLGNQIVNMVLFGSRARGDFSDESDIDVAIIVRGLTPKLKDKIFGEIAQLELEYDMPISAFVLSEEEFHQLKRREKRIALDIENEGIPL